MRAELASAPGEHVGVFCAGDLGAALVSNRSGGVWELDGWHVPDTAARARPEAGAAEDCVVPSGRAFSAHAARCWIEWGARQWGFGAVVQSHADECGDLDFYPPELAELRLGGGGGATAALNGLGSCAMVSCERGVCLSDGLCSCIADFHGPRCTLRGPLPPPPPLESPPLLAFLVAPNGTDVAGCGAPSSPCFTLRFALAEQLWQVLSGVVLDPHSDKHAFVTLARGTYTGDGFQNLVLHGNRVTINSESGPDHTLIDCTPPGTEDWGLLFERGESEHTEVSGLKLRRCMTEQQIMHAIAPNPEYAAHVAGPARWPDARHGATFKASVWV